MTQFLPPNLLALFAARDPIPYYPPADKLSHEKKRVPYSGVATYLKEFEDPKDTPPPTRVETKEERKERKRKERVEQIAYKLEQDLALWDPHNIPDGTSDPYKTLFVARINYDTSESKLRREFEVYGPIKRIRMVTDVKSAKPRGYAFIEYDHERDMHSAYKHADGKKIDGRRVLVDVERGRTVKGWQPRRLGGGLGGTRMGGPDENTRFSGRDEFGPGREGFREERRERSRSRERDRESRRRRSRSRERRRSRSRERRPNRSRSRSRERRRSRERDERPTSEGEEEQQQQQPQQPRVKDRKRRRSRSRERRRSRSRDRKSRRRSRSRERRRSKERREKMEETALEPPADHYDDNLPEIKQEPQDLGYEAGEGYGEYGIYGNINTIQPNTIQSSYENYEDS